ncbi:MULTISPECIES: outer membrane lipoprotein chaperone LolA [Methylotenera]|uniref:outer membrane lipoprotein chaperone LolA n=1 Tax=Methylotenera TaxID=359407 RepID=UPI0003718494|nr:MULTISPECIES: outer membrane lipoprotein chaperone LolA [Methylotenera]
MHQLIKKILVSSLFIASQTAFADGVASLSDFFNNTNAMRANFSQVVTDTQGRKIQEVQGSMQLQRPNKFRWDYSKPYEQQIISDGKQVFLYDTDLQQVTIRELSKTLGSSPAALLAGGDAVEKSFTIKNATRKDGLTWVLALPKEKESGFERVLLGFSDGKLRKMELYDSFNHITLITFDAVERNPTLQNSTFLFTPPKGVDVVSE